MTAGPEVAEVTATPGALPRALASGARWLWLLAPGAQPRPGALARLQAAIEPPGATRALIVAGVVVDAAGAMLSSCLPAGHLGDDDLLIRLAPAHVLPIRSAPFAHCLVDRTAFERHGLPDETRYGPHAAEAWSGRVLRDAPGHLAATSVVELGRRRPRPTGAGALRLVPPTLRMARTGTWTRGETAQALAALAGAALTR